jgi:hypothetical protein
MGRRRNRTSAARRELERRHVLEQRPLYTGTA